MPVAHLSPDRIRRVITPDTATCLCRAPNIHGHVTCVRATKEYCPRTRSNGNLAMFLESRGLFS